MDLGPRIVMAAVGLAVVLPGLALADTPPASEPYFIDEQEDCLEAVPAEYSVMETESDAAVVPLEVLVLLDGPSLERGREVVNTAARSYEPIGIELKPRFEEVDFIPERIDGDQEISSYRRLVEDAKGQTVGQRPPDVDLVYVMTNKEVDGAAGFADCIGGVRYPTRAYAIGENREPDVLSFGLNFYVNGTARILSHELGHLMGAHHHYANCSEGAGAEDVSNREPSPCTLMHNFLDFGSLNFSVVSNAVVRGHALAFAADTPGPESISTRAVSLRLSDHIYASGEVTIEGPNKCRRGVTVEIERYVGNRWDIVDADVTDGKGRYALMLDDETGFYRARVALTELERESGTHFCTQAVSPTATHSH